MNDRLFGYLVENHELDGEADEKAAREMVAALLKSGDLDPQKYAELLDETTKQKTPQDALADMLNSNASQTAKAVAEALAPVLRELAESKKAAIEEPLQKQLDEMEKKLIEKYGLDSESSKIGNDGARLMKMAREYKEEDEPVVRVKAHVERFSGTTTALLHRGRVAKQLGIEGEPIRIGSSPISSPRESGVEVNQPSERSKFLSAVVLKAQVAPEILTEYDWEVLRWIAHKERFHVPGTTQARMLTETERHEWLTALKDYYKQASLLDDTATSGGSFAVPEFFDFDMIVAPTLADEAIASFCNVVPVARGSSADNFILGIPTVDGAAEGTPKAVFDATGFIQNHDTDFHREGGFLKVGRNFLSDAHPGLASEIQAQYRRAAQLRIHRNITSGNGSTELLGIKNTAMVADVPSANSGTGGAPTLADALNLLFAVKKPFRFQGGRMNAVYIGTENAYRRMRSIATGVTGDTRLVFGMDIEDYTLFGHPFLLEEDGLDDHELIFAQLKGYRLYLRQGVRFIREDRGDTLVRSNLVLLGVDMRTGGQLDLPDYAAVMDDFTNPLP